MLRKNRLVPEVNPFDDPLTGDEACRELAEALRHADPVELERMEVEAEEERHREEELAAKQQAYRDMLAKRQELLKQYAERQPVEFLKLQPDQNGKFYKWEWELQEDAPVTILVRKGTQAGDALRIIKELVQAWEQQAYWDPDLPGPCDDPPF